MRVEVDLPGRVRAGLASGSGEGVVVIGPYGAG